MSCSGGCPRNNGHPPVYQVNKTKVCVCPAPIDMTTVPKYEPVCCPPSVKRDPRRTEVYCPPVVSRSEPLSHAEYLRRLKSGVRGGVSTPSALVQTGEGPYKKTLWMESGTVCCDGKPSVPAVHPIAHRLDNTGRAEVAGAVAGRGTLSHYDQGVRDASLTTLRAAGLALAATGSCTPCATAEGTTTAVIPVTGGCCYTQITSESTDPSPPTGLPDIAMWFDPSDPNFITSSGGNLTGFTDKAGNNNNGVGYNNLPIGGVHTVGGLPVVRFVGTGIWGNLSQAQANANFIRITNSNFNEATVTYIFIARYFSGTSGFLGTDNPGLFGRGIGCAGGNVQVIYNNNFETLSSPTLPLPVGTPVILCIQFANGPGGNLTPGYIKVSVNGVETVYTRNQAPPDNTFGFNIGGWNPTNTGNGIYDIGEVLVYTSEFTTLQRQRAEGYLAWKWGLAGSLPADHPYKNAPPPA